MSQPEHVRIFPPFDCLLSSDANGIVASCPELGLMTRQESREEAIDELNKLLVYRINQW